MRFGAWCHVFGRDSQTENVDVKAADAHQNWRELSRNLLHSRLINVRGKRRERAQTSTGQFTTDKRVGVTSCSTLRTSHLRAHRRCDFELSESNRLTTQARSVKPGCAPFVIVQHSRLTTASLTIVPSHTNRFCEHQNHS